MCDWPSDTVTRTTTPEIRRHLSGRKRRRENMEFDVAVNLEHLCRNLVVACPAIQHLCRNFVIARPAIEFAKNNVVEGVDIGMTRKILS
jgi:hypothetical protein